MSVLVVDQLVTELIQPLRIKKRLSIGSIKLHLFVLNAPAGMFHFQIFRGANSIKLWSLDVQDLRDAFFGTKDSFHIKMPFGVGENLTLGIGYYTFKLWADGYTFNEDSFVGWCKDFGGVFGGISDQNAEFTDYPFSFRLIENKQREL